MLCLTTPPPLRSPPTGVARRPALFRLVKHETLPTVSVLHPSLLLAGFLAVAIPIAIHLLLRRRRKPMPWAAMRFAQQAFARLNRRLRVLEWLLLAARCLLIVAAAVAISRPLFSSTATSQTGPSVVVMLIDDSLTDSAASVPGDSAANSASNSATVLSMNLQRARRFLTTLADGDRVAVVTLAAPAEAIVARPSSDLASVQRVLDEIASKDSRSDIAGGLAIAGTILAEARQSALVGADRVDGAGATPVRERIVVLSSLRAGTLPGDARLGRLPMATGAGALTIEMLSPLADAANISATDVQLARGLLIAGDVGAGRLASVRVARFGWAESTVVSLQMRGAVRPGVSGGTGETPDDSDQAAVSGQLSVSLAAGQSEATGSAALRVAQANQRGDGAQSGVQSVVLSAQITEASPQQNIIWRDDASYAAAGATNSVRVGIVANVSDVSADGQLTAARWFELALRPGATGPIDVSVLDAASLNETGTIGLAALIVTAPELLSDAGVAAVARLVQRGGMVLLMPAARQTVQQWPDKLLPALGIDGGPRGVISREIRSAIARIDASRLPAATSPGSELLGAVLPELEGLAGAVGVLRTLPLTYDRGGQTAPSSGNDASGADVLPLLWLTPSAANADGSGGAEATPLLALLQPALRPASGKLAAPEPPETAEPAASAGETAADGTSAQSRSRRGVVLYMATAADASWTDLPAKPLFVPLIQELVRQGAGAARRAQVTVAGAALTLDARASRLVPVAVAVMERSNASAGDDLTAPKRQAITLPTSTAGAGSSASAEQPAPPLREAGVYDVVASSGESIGLLVVKPDVRGSDTTGNTRETVARWLAPAVGGQLAGGEADKADPATEDAAGRARPRLVWLDENLQPSDGTTSTAPAGSTSPDAQATSRTTSGPMPLAAWLFLGALFFALGEVVLASMTDRARGGAAGAKPQGGSVG